MSLKIDDAAEWLTHEGWSAVPAEGRIEHVGPFFEREEAARWQSAS